MTNANFYLSGRAVAKVAGLEVERWRDMNHEAHLDCLALALESIEHPSSMEEITDFCVVAFKTGDFKQLRAGVVEVMTKDGQSQEFANALADGATAESLCIRQYIESL